MNMLIRDEDDLGKPMTDRQFVELLRTKLWLVFTARGEDEAEIAIENAITHVWSTMTRNSRVAADCKKKELELARAYGGCTNCYGKGYSTKQGFASGGGRKWRISPIKYCNCSRGEQLENMIAELRKQQEDK